MYIHYILSSNTCICVWPIWPEVNCLYFQTQENNSLLNYYTRSFPYRGPYWPGPIWASTSSHANMGVSFLDVWYMGIFILTWLSSREPHSGQVFYNHFGAYNDTWHTPQLLVDCDSVNQFHWSHSFDWQSKQEKDYSVITAHESTKRLTLALGILKLRRVTWPFFVNSAWIQDNNVLLTSL